MQVVEGVEEFLLGTLFSYDKLDIVNEKDVVVPVFVPEIRHGILLWILQRLDQLVCKGLTGHVEDLFLWIFVQYKMSYRVHQMGLPKSHASVEEQGVVHFSGRFCHGQGGRVGKAVVASNYKGIKCIFGVKTSLLSSCLCALFLGSPGCHLHDLGQAVGIFRHENDLEFLFRDLGNGHLQRESVLFINVLNAGVHIDKNENRMIYYFVYLQRFDPGVEGHIGELVLHSEVFYDFRPFFFYDIHYKITPNLTYISCIVSYAYSYLFYIKIRY